MGYSRAISGDAGRARALVRYGPIVLGVLAAIGILASAIDISTSHAGMLLVVIGCAPLVLWALTPSRTSLPLPELSGLFYAATFGLPAVVQVDNFVRGGEAAVTIATRYALLGISCFVAGSLAARPRIGRMGRLVCLERDHRLPNGIYRLSLIALALAIMYDISGMPVISLNNLVETLKMFSLVVLFFGLFSRQLGHLEWFVFAFALIPIEVVLRLFSGMVGQFAIFAVIAALMAERTGRRLQYVLALIAVLAIVGLNDIKTDYRKEFWYAGASTTGNILEKIDWARERLGDGLFDLATGSSKNSMLTRIDHLGTLSAVVEMTPSFIPYYYGQTYEELAYSWIPRVLWPDKPLANLGNRWAKDYGLLHEGDQVTSFNLPWLVELYMNFGVVGVGAGMALFGLAFQIASNRFGTRRTGTMAFLIAASVSLQLWYAESNFALMVGAIPSQILFLYVLVRVLFPSAFRPPQQLMHDTGHTGARPPFIAH